MVYVHNLLGPWAWGLELRSQQKPSLSGDSGGFFKGARFQGAR